MFPVSLPVDERCSIDEESLGAGDGHIEFTVWPPKIKTFVEDALNTGRFQALSVQPPRPKDPALLAATAAAMRDSLSLRSAAALLRTY